MATFTTRLGATKPASSENVNVTTDLNNNYDLFDSAVGAMVGTSAARPASAFSGRLWYTSDSTKLYVNRAASASTAAVWQDPVADALLSNVTFGGSLSASGGAVDVTRSASASNAFTANVSADTQKRLALTAGGVVNWGSGASAADTNLYRSTANTLKTDDSLNVAGTLTVTGTVSASAGVNVGGDLNVTGDLTVAGAGQKTYVRKAAAESVISNTTHQSDNDITFTLAASAVYELHVYIAVSGPAAGDFKTQYVFTGAASGGSHVGRYLLGAAASVGAASDTTMRLGVTTGWTTNIAYGVATAGEVFVHEWGLLDTTPGSGTITLQWAQNSSTATSTVVSTNSYATLERLA